jgi:DNA-binding response OmpR family regulator
MGKTPHGGEKGDLVVSSVMNDQPVFPEGEPGRATSRSQAEAPPRVLVVDDDSCIRELSAQTLSFSGYRVECAEDGAAAWMVLTAGKYDLLITDQTMPNLSGVELLQKLHAAHMAVPVIMATGILPTEVFTRQPWLKPNATLIKPYTVDELLGTVREVLRSTEHAPAQNSPQSEWRKQRPGSDLRLR